MLQRSLTTSLFILIASCQTAPNAPLANDAWRVQLEQSQEELRRELKSELSELQALLIPEALTGSGNPNAVAGHAPDASVDLSAQLARLGDSIERLNAAMALAGTAAPANASFGAAGAAPSGTGNAASIATLTDALLVLNEQHAVHCENIANRTVHGYKRRRLDVTTSLDEPSGLLLLQSAGSQMLMNQGVLELTGNQLDFGIEGEGFFQIQLPSGERHYTRNGTFRQRVDGRLLTAEGNMLTDQLSIPPDSQGISIDSNGLVYSLHGDSKPTVIGTIRLHVFANAAGLEPKAANSYVPTNSSGSSQARPPGIQGAGQIKQGYLERSNVEVTRELIEMQLIERQASAVRRALAGQGIYTR